MFALGAMASAALSACGGGGSSEGDSASGQRRSDQDALASDGLIFDENGTRRLRSEVPAATWMAAALTTGTTGTTGPAYPFGARLNAYGHGIRPSRTQAEMDSRLKNQYDAWKAARVVPADFVVAGGYAVRFSQQAFLTVSEAMGYGMLLAVLFAGHDPDARKVFDGMLAVVRARPAYGVTQYYNATHGKYLMDWRLNADGTSGGEGWAAADGDMDIALALLMADKQWGSSGTWNYLQEARNTITALKTHTIMGPDGTTRSLYRLDISRTSDYMFGHFRAYQAATGDAFWGTVIDRSLQLTELMQTKFAPSTGLVPDFIVGTDTADPAPAPAYGGGDRSEYDGHFYWNACRNPWRWGSDYLLSGDARVKTVAMRLLDFFHGKFLAAGGDIMAAVDCGYRLDGSAIAGGDSAAFIAPVLLGGCIDAKYQQMVDAAWTWNAARPVTGYYDGEIQLLSLVAASGNWWTPHATAAAPAPEPVGPGPRCLSLIPATAAAASESLAALAVSRATQAKTYTFKAQICTKRQLRAQSPGYDEAAWVVWNYVDRETFYYFSVGPGGWEFGKSHPIHGQKMIKRGTNFKAAIGTRNVVEVRVFGEWADVYVNGTYCAYVQDNGYKGSPKLLGGKVGLLALDAECTFDNVALPVPDNFNGEAPRTLAAGEHLANWTIEFIGNGTAAIVAE